MTDEQRRQQVAALLAERRGYEARLVDADNDSKSTLTERIAAVDASLGRLGYQEPAKILPKEPVARPSEKVASRSK